MKIEVTAVMPSVVRGSYGGARNMEKGVVPGLIDVVVDTCLSTSSGVVRPRVKVRGGDGTIC